MLIVQTLVALAVSAAVLVPLERLIPMHPRQRALRSGLVTDLVHASVSGAIIQAGMIATLALIGLATAAIVPPGIGQSIRALPGWGQFALMFVLSDFLFYVGHVIVHKVPVLWRFHTIHHSSEQLDWIAAHRVHPVDQLFNGSLIAVPGIALGFAPEVLIAYALIYRWHALLLHSNVRIPLGLLGRVITTPHFHHWHHAREEAAHDRNFGGQLAIWDRLFGTLHAPARLPNRYGIDQSLPDDYIGQVAYPFRTERRGSTSPIVTADA